VTGVVAPVVSAVAPVVSVVSVVPNVPGTATGGLIPVVPGYGAPPPPSSSAGTPTPGISGTPIPGISGTPGPGSSGTPGSGAPVPHQVRASSLAVDLPSSQAAEGPNTGAPSSSLPMLPQLSAGSAGDFSVAGSSGRGPGGGTGNGGGNSGSGVQGGARAGALSVLPVSVLLRRARRADAKPIWRAYLPEVPPA
jgi:hypothetical protein